MNNVLLYLGGLLVVTLAALFAVPHFIDWNGYRGIFEEEATKVLGRDVRVGGAVNVRLLPTPFVSFEKVRLADPEGQTGEPFVRAESFTMRLSFPALLRGVLEAKEVELDKPVLSLALNERGGGNWSSIQIRAGALPFVPKDVTLRAVRINEGIVNFYSARAKPIAKAEAIDGIFSADSVKGPFNFKGSAGWSGRLRDVRFATTVPDAAGSFQLKVNLRDVSSSATYLLDATIADLASAPRLTGQLSGTFPLTEAMADEEDDGQVPLMEIKARVEADTAGAEIQDLALSVQNAAEPQLISGLAKSTWGDVSEFDVALTSKWLDLDRLAGAGADTATLAKVKHLGLSVLRALAGDGKATAKLDIEQVKLGGETTGSMRINAARRGTSVTVKELRAGLPGGARLDLSGDVKDAAGAVSFAGAGFIHGTNFARLLEWADKSGVNLDVEADGPFSAEGRVLIADKRFELTEASADIGGRPFTGDIVVSDEDRRKVSVTLEAARIDTSELFPQTAAALEDNLRRALGIEVASTGAEAPASPSAAGADSDISVRILAGELEHKNGSYHDVDLMIGLDGDLIRIPAAKFKTESGLEARINGLIDIAKTSKGTIAYDFVAGAPGAVRDLARLTGLVGIVADDKISSTTTAKVAGLLRLGSRGANSADITVDGTIEATRLQATAEFDGGLDGWRSEPSRIRMTVRGPSLPSLLLALGREGQEAAPSQSDSEAELVVASTGTLADGATAIADLSAPGFTAAMRGNLILNDEHAMGVTASLDLKASDVRDALSVAGLAAGQGTEIAALEGTFDIISKAESWGVSSGRFKLGGTSLKGAAEITGKSGEEKTISATIEADTLMIDDLLSTVTDRSTEATMASEGGESRVIWPRGTFNFGGLKPSSGKVTVKFGTLRLDTGLAMHDGAMNIALSPEKIEVGTLSGAAAGGAVTANFAFTKAPSGTRFDGTLQIANADLGQLSANGGGTATLDLKAYGQAQSPAGLIGVLSGDGKITLENAKMRSPAPETGTAILKAVMDEAIANNADSIAAEVEKAIHATSAQIGSRTVALKILNGIVKLDPFTIASERNSVTATTTADLMTLRLDSAWKLVTAVPRLPPLAEPVVGYTPRQPKGPLPPIEIVYTGKMGNLAALEINVDAENMQRELAVQLMERNVEQLERVRIQDEFRAQEERKRRKAEEQDRAAEKAAAEKAATEQPAPSPDGSSEPPLAAPEGAGAVGQDPAAPPGPQSGAGDTDPVAAPPNPAPVVQPEARPRPRVRREQAHGSPADDVTRSLGGYP